MFRRIIHYFLFLVPFLSFGQTDLILRSHFLNDTSQKVSVSIFSNYFFTSNAITNKMATDYLLGKFIDDNTKDGVSKNLNARNYFNSELNTELAFIFHPDSNHRNIEAFIAVRDRYSASSDFRKDVFELFFRGNKNYAGLTAELSDTKYQTIKYRQFAVGIGNKFQLEDSASISLAADLGVNSGANFLFIETGHSTLYTHPEGEYIDADLQATIQREDSSDDQSIGGKGTGISADIYARYETRNEIINFSAENIGSIRWNSFSTEVIIDSTFRFEGIEVEDIFSFGDSLKSSTSIDSTYYYNLIRHREQKRITTKLPLKISASYSRYFKNNRIFATVGIDFIKCAYNSSRYFAAADYAFNKSSQAGLILAYDIRTGFQSGIKYVHLFPSNFRIEVGSNYLSSMINYQAGTDQGAYLNISKGF